MSTVDSKRISVRLSGERAERFEAARQSLAAARRALGDTSEPSDAAVLDYLMSDVVITCQTQSDGVRHGHTQSDEPTPAPRTHADDSYNLSSIKENTPYSPSNGARGTRASGTNPRALGTNPRAVDANPRAADNRGVVVAQPEDGLTPHQLRTAQRVLHRWGKTLSAKYGAVEPCDSIPPALARAVQRWPSSRQWDAAIDRLDDMSKAAIARYSMTTLEHACRAPRSQPGGLPKLFEDYRAAQKDPPPLHEVLSGKQLDNWRRPPESVTAPTADDAERWCRLLAENDPVWWIELTAEMRRKAGKVREHGKDPEIVLIGHQGWTLGANGDGPAWRGLLDPIIRAAIQQTQQREEDEE